MKRIFALALLGLFGFVGCAGEEGAAPTTTEATPVNPEPAATAPAEPAAETPAAETPAAP